MSFDPRCVSAELLRRSGSAQLEEPEAFILGEHRLGDGLGGVVGHLWAPITR